MSLKNKILGFFKQKPNTILEDFFDVSFKSVKSKLDSVKIYDVMKNPDIIKNIYIEVKKQSINN